MTNAQELEHPDGFDYIEGSPHLKDPELRRLVERSLAGAVKERVRELGRCQVLEVGAGHGVFTDVMLDAGAVVTVTEMSGPSARAIKRKYAAHPLVEVVHDETGTWIRDTKERFDVVACISVLHHIPDYVEFFRSAVGVTRPGGSFVSWQDPTWYPRRDTRTHQTEKAFYYLWRVQQGDLRRGLSTRLRRIRGELDEANPADMSEYHVVRSGVDDKSLLALAHRHYRHAELKRYWSSQSTLGMRMGRHWNLPTNFALVATGREVGDPDLVREP